MLYKAKPVLLLSLLVSVLTVCSSNPLQTDPVVSQPTDPFAGSITGCRVPNSSYCGVTYSVPDSIATLVRVSEEEIRGHVEMDIMPGQELDACQRLKKEVLCAQRFPQCVDNTVILTSSPNCEERIRNDCSGEVETLLNQNFCGLEDMTIPMGTCSTITQFNQDSVLSHCSVLGGNVQVTEWMYKLISFTDSQLESSLGADQTLHLSSPTCSESYARYFCQIIGQCSEDGSKISVKNDYHLCEKTVSCYDNMVADILRPIFPCNQWDSLDFPTSDLQTTTPNPVVSDTTGSVKPLPSIDPGDRSLPGAGSGVDASRYSLLVILTCLSVLCLQYVIW